MKNLLTGVAIAAALVISAPAWAQNNAPMKPAAAPAKPAATAPAMNMKKPMMAKRHVMHRRRMAGGEDSMTEQLNRQELSRIQGGGMAGGPAPDRLQGPKVGPK
jgi:hypothetical protein